MTQPQGTSGRVLADRYRLESVLGSGGMGTVWKAEDEMLGRIVAVKELRMHGGVDDDERHRLIVRTLREAKATARIRHTAAVTVFDVVEEDDRPWIVMELVDGRSLAEVVKEDGPVTPVRAAEIGLELLGVLGAAHSQGILHRDVKPSNVLIGEDGRVVLTDFGIASVEGDSSVTSTGMLVGAPSYISPERARGQKPGPPADLWSLGGTLYAALEGKPPYDKGSALATLTAVMTEELPPPANAGPLRPVIEGLLDKDPAKRLDASTTRSMLKRIVAESTARAEATTKTKMLPVVDGAAEAEAETSGASGASGAAGASKVDSADAAIAAAKDKAKPKTKDKAKAKPSGLGLSSVRVGSTARAAEPAAAEPPAPAAAAAAAAQPPAAKGGDGGWSRSATLGAAARWSKRRQLLVAALVLILLVAGGVWLASTQTSGGGKTGASRPTGAGAVAGAPATSAAPSKPAASSPAASSPAPSSAAPGSATPSGAAPGSGSQSNAAPSNPAPNPAPPGNPAPGGAGSGGQSPTGSGVPAGYQLISDPSGFKIVLPQWMTDQGVGYRATTKKFGGHGLSLLVDWQSPANSSALADWQSSDANGPQNFTDYQRVQVAALTYRQWTNAADWEWTYSGSSGRMHSLNRGFVVDNGKYGYALMWTASDADWNSADFTAARQTGFASFEPAP
ncbi:serine/threonine protein kinase [Kitasatospora acidiphila]|uniref:non-specific serine/threonine protein kinase n=1 Tax=Kitasatospora acidiphila TaxID=2567942 RepID=A0A540W7Q9_9ACTN|nr:serine/threonine-protein kinase [Kitasatospora acidiphila]TQF05055.1 serine/threonine protein kinase [Kitasatospora acidiphila]